MGISLETCSLQVQTPCYKIRYIKAAVSKETCCVPTFLSELYTEYFILIYIFHARIYKGRQKILNVVTQHVFSVVAAVM